MRGKENREQTKRKEKVKETKNRFKLCLVAEKFEEKQKGKVEEKKK